MGTMPSQQRPLSSPLIIPSTSAGRVERIDVGTRAGDVPPFAFSTHNVPSTANPLGVKGAGEAGAVGAPPAVINAIVDALHGRVELRHIDMPATARRVWEMLNGIH